MTIDIDPHNQAVLLEGVSWDLYTHMLDELGASGRVRFIYDEGTLEIVTTSDLHGYVQHVIARLIEMYSIEADVPISGRGQVTLRRQLKAKGLEPDECYYVRTPAPKPSMGELNLNVFPPPDLAIEVEITRGTVPKRPIYAALGVAEVWRYDMNDRRVIPMRLQPDGSYADQQASELFPNLPWPPFTQFLREALDAGHEHEAIKRWRDFLRGQGA